jgi:hypothetical protein
MTRRPTAAVVFIFHVCFISHVIRLYNITPIHHTRSFRLCMLRLMPIVPLFHNLLSLARRTRAGAEHMSTSLYSTIMNSFNVISHHTGAVAIRLVCVGEPRSYGHPSVVFIVLFAN